MTPGATTVRAVLPEFRRYQGPALEPLAAEGRLTRERIVECAEAAAERRDGEGLRLARVLLALSVEQRRDVIRRLTLPSPFRTVGS